VIDLESLSAFRALLAEHEEKINRLQSDVEDLSKIAAGLTELVKRHEKALHDVG